MKFFQTRIQANLQCQRNGLKFHVIVNTEITGIGYERGSLASIDCIGTAHPVKTKFLTAG